MEQFFYPEGWGGAELPRDLTTALARHGFDVEVICGSDQYAPVAGDCGPDPEAQGVRIRRIPGLLGGDVHRFKLIRQLWFCAALLPVILLRRRPSLFVSQTNPPLAVLIVAAVSRLLFRPYLLIAMDVYPEVLEIHGALRREGIASQALRWLFNRAYSAARRVVALGPVMRDRLVKKGVAASRIIEICNWSTGATGVVRGSANQLRTTWELGDRFVLVYSGNLGIGHEFDTLLRGFASALQHVSSIRLVIIGKGARLQEVRQLTEQLGLRHVVRFSDFVPSAQLPESMGLADLAVVTLRPGFEGLIVPSKLLGYMSRGIPVLYVGPRSDVEYYLQRYRCGVCIRNGNVDEVARAILEASRNKTVLAAMGDAGRVGYDADLSRERALDLYIKVITECIGAQPSSEVL